MPAAKSLATCGSESAFSAPLSVRDIPAPSPSVAMADYAGDVGVFEVPAGTARLVATF